MTNRTDSFARGDTTNNIGSPSDGGSAWVQQAGVWGISSEQAYESSGDVQCVATLESSVANVDVQATASTVSGQAGLIARFSSTTSYILLVVESSGFTLYRRDGGGFNSIGTWSGTVSSGDDIKLTCDGTSVKAYHEGVERISVTESHNQTETKHGIRAHGAVNWRWDDFSITEVGAVTPFRAMFRGS
jgi:hypothetical protein